MKIETIVSAINNGYNILEDNSFEALSIWTNVWDYIKTLKQGNIIKYFVDLEKITDEDIYFFDEWIQDYELELSSYDEDTEFINKRLDLCKTILEIYPAKYMEILTRENFKSAMAECYYKLGDKEKADELFGKWLAEDPTWGFRWINWVNCYILEEEKDFTKAGEILERALKVENMDDRFFLLERAIDFYDKIGDFEKSKQYEDEFIAIYNEQHVFDENYNKPRRVVKIGRNEPCPCGSGKKYKKCCGG